MDQLTIKTQNSFDSIKRYRASGDEYWCARDLMKLLGYAKWDRFGASEGVQPSVIQRAITSAKVSETHTQSQFLYIEKLIDRVQGGTTIKEECELSRYACYLVAMMLVI